MVKANELRIGNLVYKVIDGPYITKDGGISDGPNKNIHSVTPYDFDCSLKMFQPIPLTPEILEKAGFEKQDKYWHLYDPHFEYLVDMQPLFYLKGVPMAAFQYLHQLQNLYYSLTGEELTINLPQPVQI